MLQRLNLDKLTFRAQLILGNAVVLVLMVCISLVVYLSINKLLDNSKWVEHTHGAIGYGNGLIAEMINMETGMRGFLVSGKDEFLEPYVSGEQRLEQLMAEAKQKVSDNPAQVARLEKIHKLAHHWKEKAAETQIAERRKANEGAAAITHFKQVSARTIGKQIFDSIRVEIKRIDAKFQAGNGTRGRHLMTGLLLDLVNMETGQRGFLLTGLDESLEPYREGFASLQNSLKNIKTYVRRNPGFGVRVRDINKVEGLVNEWMEKAADPEIAARRAMNLASTSMDDVAALVEQGAGKKYMDELRGLVEAFIAVEVDLLGVRSVEAEGTAAMVINVSIFGTLLAVLIAVSIIWLQQRILMQQLGGEPTAAMQLAEEIARGNLAVGADARQQASEGLMGSMQSMSGSLRTMFLEITDETGVLADSATNLSDLSGVMKQNSAETTQKSSNVAVAAERMSHNLAVVASSAEQASANLSSVVSSTEEMTSTIAQISDQAEKVRGISSSAVSLAEQSSETVNLLGQAAEKIGEVTESITAISDQTNLLAFNATIEAARSGEAGKGFTVVAHEVKQLARQTSEATSEIAKQINGIQKSSQATVEQIHEISKVIVNINEFISLIAHAMKEQSIATRVISTNISEATQGIDLVNENVAQAAVAAQDVAQDMNQVSQSNASMSEAAGSVISAVKSLNDISSKLKVMMNQFSL